MVGGSSVPGRERIFFAILLHEPGGQRAHSQTSFLAVHVSLHWLAFHYLSLHWRSPTPARHNSSSIGGIDKITTCEIWTLVQCTDSVSLVVLLLLLRRRLMLPGEQQQHPTGSDFIYGNHMAQMTWDKVSVFGPKKREIRIRLPQIINSSKSWQHVPGADEMQTLCIIFWRRAKGTWEEETS